MLRKGDNFLNNLNITKKNKLYTEPNENYCDLNKENLCSKSLFEHLNDSSGNEHLNKQKEHEQSGYGSTMISPTFQSPDLVNLKDDRFRQDKSYLNINFSLKDMDKASKDTQKTNSVKQGDNAFKANQQKYGAQLREVEQLKRRLVEHYSKKKYWKKIEALFQQEGVNAVLAWEDAIQKYKQVKASNQQIAYQNRKLEEEIVAKDQKIFILEKQIAQDKNETKVLSHKKCKGCETLQQKQKDYFELYEQNKKYLKHLEQSKEALAQTTDQYKKIDQKYKNLVFLKEQVEKKNGKLLEREKQLTSQLQKMEKAFKEDNSNSKDLHIQIEQLKQAKYQIEKSATKLQEKQKREVADLKLELSGLEQQKNILSAQSEKIRIELNQTKSKLFKMQFQLESIDETLKIKMIQCEDLKKRHIQNMSEQMRRKNGLDDSLKSKQEELRKAYHLMDEVQNAKVNLEMELNQERKTSATKDKELSRQLDNIKEVEERLRESEDKLREMEDKIRQSEQNQHRIKEVSVLFNGNRNKNANITNLQGNYQSSSPHSNTLLIKISCKIKQLHSFLTQANQQNPDSYQKRKSRDDLSEERQQVNLLKTEKYINEIYTQFSNFRNKYDFVNKENDNLKIQIENEITYKQREVEQLQRQIDLKQEALRSITSWVPEQLRQLLVEFLCMTERLSNDQHHEEIQFQEYEELKQNLDIQGKQWKDNYQKMDRRLKKMQDQVRRVEDENEQLKRRLKIKDPKRPVQAEYDYRQVSKKDIRKKYNLDN